MDLTIQCRSIIFHDLAIWNPDVALLCQAFEPL
jgi:hypothetical protein